MMDTTTLLAALEHHPLPTIDLSLERIRLFLERLGHPEHRLPPVIHVAGTNGKGSTIAFLAAMLSASGKRVHRYTSPHLVRFHERIAVGDTPIDDGALRPLLERVLEAARDFPVTYFESTTAAAFLAFADHPADYLLLEVGLGGRLDATNIIERPALTVITPVSRDHTEYLGDSLAAIAREKAGILKSGVPCVVAPQRPEALAAIEVAAEQTGCPLFRCGHEWAFEPGRQGFTYRSRHREYRGCTPVLPGPHQYANAATAIACMEQLGQQPDTAPIRRGLAEAVWPGRLQHLTRGPLVEAMPAGATLWLDGGHNPGAGDILGAWCASEEKRPHAVIGMMQGKDAAGFLAPLAAHLASLSCVPIAGENCQPPPALCAVAARLGLDARPFDTPAEAIAALPSPARDVLIAGSLYLAGQILAGHG